MAYGLKACSCHPLNWIEIVKIQKIVLKQDILLKFGGHFEKNAL